MKSINFSAFDSVLYFSFINKLNNLNSLESSVPLPKNSLIIPFDFSSEPLIISRVTCLVNNSKRKPVFLNFECFYFSHLFYFLL